MQTEHSCSNGLGWAIPSIRHPRNSEHPECVLGGATQGNAYVPTLHHPAFGGRQVRTKMDSPSPRIGLVGDDPHSRPSCRCVKTGRKGGIELNKGPSKRSGISTFLLLSIDRSTVGSGPSRSLEALSSWRSSPPTSRTTNHFSPAPHNDHHRTFASKHDRLVTASSQTLLCFQDCRQQFNSVTSCMLPSWKQAIPLLCVSLTVEQLARC